MSIEDQTTTLPVVPTASLITTRYFRDEEEPTRVLTLVARRALGFVEIGYAVNRPDRLVPYTGRLYRRTMTQVPIDPSESALLQAIDKKFGHKRLSKEDLQEIESVVTTPIETAPPAPEEKTRFEQIPSFCPVFVDGLMLDRGDVFCKTKGRELALARLNNVDERVLSLPKPGETLLKSALRGLRDDDRTRHLNGEEYDFVPECAKLIADNVIGWLEEEQAEIEEAERQNRKPFWHKVKEFFTFKTGA